MKKKTDKISLLYGLVFLGIFVSSGLGFLFWSFSFWVDSFAVMIYFLFITVALMTSGATGVFFLILMDRKDRKKKKSKVIGKW